MDAITIFFLMGLLMFLLGMGGFMLYVLFGTWNPRKILRQKRWAKEFAQEVGVDLPSGFVVQKSDDELSSGHFWLKYPYWERPKADGTRDRRLSNNNIIRPLSTLMFSHWKIEGHDPWEMYCLVQQMRKKGQRISLCKEELEKKATLSKQLSQTEANSVFEIVSRYEESPAGFEHFCADIFRQLGYKAEVTPPANDGGYDILLSRDSMADKSLTDNRFGSFTNILALCNKQVNEGDQLLTVQYLVPERERSFYGGWRSDTWVNTRGRGDRNRTHDCSVEDCKLYKANVVEYDEPEEWLRYRYEVGKKPDGSPKYAGPYRTRADSSLDPEVEILEQYTVTERHVFVSVPKASSGWRTGTESRSNFELYNNEFINLTYMNSVWLEWVITNNKLGGWTIGGKAVDYAYAIRYLKKAMDYIRQREKQEKAFIDAVDPQICKDPDWPLKLTQWKLDKQVRTITEYQAKRFAKAYPNLDGKINIEPAPDNDIYMYI